jgi:hypothetical protein
MKTLVECNKYATRQRSVIVTVAWRVHGISKRTKDAKVDLPVSFASVKWYGESFSVSLALIILESKSSLSSIFGPDVRASINSRMYTLFTCIRVTNWHP